MCARRGASRQEWYERSGRSRSRSRALRSRSRDVTPEDFIRVQRFIPDQIARDAYDRYDRRDGRRDAACEQRSQRRDESPAVTRGRRNEHESRREDRRDTRRDTRRDKGQREEHRGRSPPRDARDDAHDRLTQHAAMHHR